MQKFQAWANERLHHENRPEPQHHGRDRCQKFHHQPDHRADPARNDVLVMKIAFLHQGTAINSDSNEVISVL